MLHEKKNNVASYFRHMKISTKNKIKKKKRIPSNTTQTNIFLAKIISKSKVGDCS